jgi:ABC-type transport system substrate-binding protein
VFRAAARVSEEDKPIAQALEGKRLPLLDRIDIRVMEEDQARLLSFLKGDIDYLEQVPPSLAGMVINNGKLKPELAHQGIALSTFAPLQTVYLWMNMEDPVIGGYSQEKIALRRAIALAYPRSEDIAQISNGFALPASSPLPPGVSGFDTAYRNPNSYDPALARQLLERFGYRMLPGSPYRTLPDGRPLTLTMHSLATSQGRLRDELWKRSLDAIGIQVEFKSGKLSELIKAARLGTLQMAEFNWLADYPDADNFFQLLYGPNAGKANYARFALPEFDRLYERTKIESNEAVRMALYRDMNNLLHGYAPWVICFHPLWIDLQQARLRNYRHHPVALTAWRYLDVAASGE